MDARVDFWLACCPDPEPALLAQGFGHLQSDSRAVLPGDVFIALAGHRVDGKAFINAAIERGASAIIEVGASASLQQRANVWFIQLPTLVARLGELAALYYHHPSSRLSVHAITGTNGKTSCSHFLAQALSDLKQSVAVIGTLGVGVLGQLSPSPNTTPDAVTLQRTLADFVAKGIQHVAMEASSIAIVEGRLNGCRLASAILTNLSRDHLDYHGDMGAYGEAKAQLFAWPGLERVVINQADPFSEHCVARVAPGVAIYRYHLGADATDAAQTLSAELLPLEPFVFGLRAQLRFNEATAVVDSPLVGAFNLENLLAISALLLALGFALPALPAILTTINAVPGRLQRLGGALKPSVIIDYAHTPAALAEVLQCLRPYVRGQLWCVFGCGGDRDSGKRPEMGLMAGKLADYTILTSDNPRFEQADVILSAIAAGMPSMANYEIIAERGQAIESAIARARAGDVILIAGKGHETYQQIGAINYPFNDVLIASACLAK